MLIKCYNYQLIIIIVVCISDWHILCAKYRYIHAKSINKSIMHRGSTVSKFLYWMLIFNNLLISTIIFYINYQSLCNIY